MAAALARLRRRVPIVMVGGNHDRWGGDFWERDVGVRFDPHRLSFDVGRRHVAALHGDGLTEPRFRAALVHRAINHPATAAIYRAIHPEIGLRLVDRLSPWLGDHTADAGQFAQAAERQREWATGLFAAEPELGLVIMGHSHQPALAEPIAGAPVSQSRRLVRRSPVRGGHRVGRRTALLHTSGTTSACPIRSPIKRAPT